MKRYNSYIDSGIEWVGEIPENWFISKFKYQSNIYNGDSLSDDKKILFESDDIENQYPYISTKNIEIEYSTINYDSGLKIPKSEKKYKVAPIGSFLLCIEGGSAGRKIAYLNQEVCFVNKLACFVSNNNSKLLFYYAKSTNFQSQFKLSMSGLIGGVAISSIRNFDIVLPPINEQEQIVAYLDKKTAIVDTLIASKEEKINLLKEKRTALINQTITKGLDPNVKLKDSGVEWIGEIPKHWDVKKLKHLTLIISKGTTPSTVGREISDEGEIRYLKAENIKENEVTSIPAFYIDLETNESIKRSTLLEGDILFVIAGATIGKVAILKKELTPANTNQAISFIRLNNLQNRKYIWYWLSSSKIQEQMWVVAVQSAQPNLSMENLGNFQIPYPLIKEQEQIVEYLDKQTQEIDELISLEQKKIETLKEYRQALISEVVTGKIKVVK